MGCHFLLQGIFLTQGSKPGLLHCRQTLYHMSHPGSRGRGHKAGNANCTQTLLQLDKRSQNKYPSVTRPWSWDEACPALQMAPSNPFTTPSQTGNPLHWLPVPYLFAQCLNFGSVTAPCGPICVFMGLLLLCESPFVAACSCNSSFSGVVFFSIRRPAVLVSYQSWYDIFLLTVYTKYFLIHIKFFDQ